MSILVEFNGIQYWYQADSLNKSAALAPLEHCDEQGNPIVLAISFAHCYPQFDEINRFGRQIGTMSDLKIVK